MAHVGRSWQGHPLEDDCPCTKAACGLVAKVAQHCPEHDILAAKTMRQMHRAEDCPAAPVDASPDHGGNDD